jgi:hypothetical protein
MTSSRAGSMTVRSMAGSFAEDHLGCSQRAMPVGITLLKGDPQGAKSASS